VVGCDIQGDLSLPNPFVVSVSIAAPVSLDLQR